MADEYIIALPNDAADSGSSIESILQDRNGSLWVGTRGSGLYRRLPDGRIEHYGKRDPDSLYLNWIMVLDTTGDFRGMVNGFMNSLEYRFRFGP